MRNNRGLYEVAAMWAKRIKIERDGQMSFTEVAYAG